MPHRRQRIVALHAADRHVLVVQAQVIPRRAHGATVMVLGGADNGGKPEAVRARQVPAPARAHQREIPAKGPAHVFLHAGSARSAHQDGCDSRRMT